MPVESGAQAANNIREMGAAIVIASEKAAVQFGVLAANKVKELLTEKHSGPSYPARPGKPGGNPSSLPGEPPALQTGWLRASYSSWTEAPGVVAIGSRGTPPGGKNYAAFLEFGTSRMAARPHLRPAIDSVRETLAPLVRSETTAAQGEARGKMGP